MNESNEFYREEINKMLASIDRNDVLEYVYTIVSDIMGGRKNELYVKRRQKKKQTALQVCFFFS